jgi:hypothetical protein
MKVKSHSGTFQGFCFFYCQVSELKYVWDAGEFMREVCPNDAGTLFNNNELVQGMMVAI